MRDDQSGDHRHDVGEPGRDVAGWYADPVGDHDLRYHNGVRWTGDVSTDGQRFVAPLVPPISTRRRTGTLAMVAGVVALAISWIPFVFVIGVCCALVAIIAGVQGQRDPNMRGASTAGIATGGAALVLAAGGAWLSVVVFRSAASFENPGRHDTVLDECAQVGDGTRATGSVTNLEDDTRSYVITVEFEPGRSSQIEVDDVAANETGDFVIDEDDVFNDLDCSITKVNGPYPFGVVIEE